MVIHIPQPKKRDSKMYKVADSSFKLFVKNLRTGMESAVVSTNLRLGKASELASFNFNIFRELHAQVRNIGQISHNRELGLTLLGLEGQEKDYTDDQLEVGGKMDNTVLERQLVDTLEPEVGHQLGARPKRLKLHPRRLDGYEIYSVSLLESQFMKLDSVQRQNVVKALRLHLSICHNNCTNHNLFYNLCENYDKLNHFYEEIPYGFVKKKLNKGQSVKFANVVSFSNGEKGDLASYKISLDYVDNAYLLGNTLIDLTLKELTTVKRAHC